MNFYVFGSFRLLVILKFVVHSKTNAIFFRNVVSVYPVTMEKAQMHTSHMSQVRHSALGGRDVTSCRHGPRSLVYEASVLGNI